MGFIREKIKNKPINKKRLAINIGLAGLCGGVFALALYSCMLLLMPSLKEMMALDGSELLGNTEDTSVQALQENQGVLIPPDFHLSLENYQELQQQFYNIGLEANRAVVTISNKDAWRNHTTHQAQGAGMIIAADNNYLYILTERSVLANIDNLRVTFVNQAGADAKLLKLDQNTGLAVLTVEMRQLNTSTQKAIIVAKMGSSKELTNGSLIVAIGSPFGTAGAVVMGNIVATNKQLGMQDCNYSVITTDIAAVEQGSGVLLNIQGEIVGMMIADVSAGNATITAVPIDAVSVVVEQLKNGKDIPYIGLYISTITEDIAKDYELPLGIFIKEVVADSPAMKAGLQSGDVITHINGEEVVTDAAYSEKIRQLIPGTTCEILVKRQNGSEYYEVTCVVTIGVL